MFAIDLSVPLGVAVAAGHLFAVLLAVRAPTAHLPLAVAAGCTVLTGLGWLLSAPGVTTWVVAPNRLISIGVIWGATILALQRKQVEVALEGERSQAQAVLETAVDAVVTIDERGVIQSWNPAAGRMFGYTPADVLGQNVSLLMPEPFRGEHADYLRRYLQTNERRIIGIGREVTARRKDGSLFPVRLAVGEAQTGAAVRQFTGFIQDISELKEAERELREFAAELERSNRELQDFATVASHDLQEPLRKIQAFGDRLRARADAALDETCRDYLRRMLDAAGRMRTLIDDLLTFSRVTSKAQPHVPVDLGQVLAGVLSDLEASSEATPVIEVAADLPRVEADPTQMRQLFQNLVGNALKFHRPGEPPRVEIRVEPPPGPGRVRVVVEDHGIGFEPRHAERIFGLFQRLHGRSEYQGTGIGLAVCRKIVERHGGTISAEGRPGAGARFLIDLPCRQQSPRGEPACRPSLARSRS